MTKLRSPLLLFPLGALGLGLCGCSDDASDQEVETVTLEFRAQIGDAPFACGQSVPSPKNPALAASPRDFRFFVSAVSLIRADGERVPVKLEDRAPFQAHGVALLDFEDGTADCSNGNAALNAQVTGQVTAGDYVGVAFSTSVPEELNHQNPAELEGPLQAGGMTWGWLAGFKFLRAELVESSNDGAAEAGSFLMHLGSVGCMQREGMAEHEHEREHEDAEADHDQHTGGASHGSDQSAGGATGMLMEVDPALVSCSKPHRNEVRLMGFDPLRQVIVADLGALVADVDLSTETTCHSAQASCTPFLDVLGLDAEDGTSHDNQSFFRIGDLD